MRPLQRRFVISDNPSLIVDFLPWKSLCLCVLPCWLGLFLMSPDLCRIGQFTNVKICRWCARQLRFCLWSCGWTVVLSLTRAL